jgi:hypothetical protein
MYTIGQASDHQLHHIPRQVRTRTEQSRRVLTVASPDVETAEPPAPECEWRRSCGQVLAEGTERLQPQQHPSLEGGVCYGRREKRVIHIYAASVRMAARFRLMASGIWSRSLGGCIHDHLLTMRAAACYARRTMLEVEI